MTLAAFLSIWFLHLLAAVSPGPAVLVSARTGLTKGFVTGFWLSVGIGIGGVIWAAAALFGLALVFQAAPGLLLLLKICGGAYLVWMGWKMWQTADVALDVSSVGDVPQTPLGALIQGVGTQLANPKPAILFSAIFLGTVPPETSNMIYVAILLAVFLNETIWNTAVARVFSFNRTRGIYLGLKSLIDKCFGGALALLGVKIATV